jgi:hypothetical protein
MSSSMVCISDCLCLDGMSTVLGKLSKTEC